MEDEPAKISLPQLVSKKTRQSPRLSEKQKLQHDHSLAENPSQIQYQNHDPSSKTPGSAAFPINIVRTILIYI